MSKSTQLRLLVLAVTGFSLVSCMGQGGPDSATAFGVDEFASNDPNHITLAVRWVNYTKSDGTPVLDTHRTKEVLRAINQVWAQCNLHFRIEDYQEINPTEYGLPFNPNSASGMYPIRNALEDNSTLLVVNTGPWVGGGAADAWTSMPGTSPYGAIMDSGVADNANIIAHELGHYLGLRHASAGTNLLSPVVYTNSNVLTRGQCEGARETAQEFWPNMLRT